MTTAPAPQPAGLLACAVSAQREAQAAETRLWEAAAEWCAAHAEGHVPDCVAGGPLGVVTEELLAAYEVEGGDRLIGAGGPGTPLVAEFAIIELATALGRSDASGRAFVGAVMETRFRLPLLWEAMTSGRVPPWRVRRIAEETMRLGSEAAGFVDRMITPVAHKTGLRALDGLVADAVARYEPETHEADLADAHAAKHVTIELDQSGRSTIQGAVCAFDGLVRLDGLLDRADAEDLDHALRHLAAEQSALGSPLDLGERRAAALGQLARNQTMLDLGGGVSGGVVSTRSAVDGLTAQPPGSVVVSTRSAVDGLTAQPPGSAVVSTRSAVDGLTAQPPASVVVSTRSAVDGLTAQPPGSPVVSTRSAVDGLTAQPPALLVVEPPDAEGEGVSKPPGSPVVDGLTAQPPGSPVVDGLTAQPPAPLVVEPPDAEGEGVSKPPQPTTVPASVPARQLVLHVRLSSEAITGTGTPSIDPVTGALGLHLARVCTATGAHRATVTAEQVATWAGNPDTQVIVKPVVDLADTVAVDAYEIPDRIAYRVTEQRQTCAFPFCTRSAMRADLDHIDEYVPMTEGGPPGQTGTDTLAPLCRTHHRAKTHPSPSHQAGRSERRWRYRRIRPGLYVWTSPHGRHFLVDPDGTEHLT
ncbi:hypothetical protein [Nocardioides acrostichi]|uniref:HNH nuclease domain-containing protein n=1 Tax=Nocardioides acrostichi TaxID=2784339 RepID=A0A930UY61_9ACTN|nr:hypothetical protein [Nocardioides acrostichi]MBF4161862.1 hypothetical protein [Nocardioides acrostichi]